MMIKQQYRIDKQESKRRACVHIKVSTIITLSIIINFTESPFVHSRKEYDKNVHEQKLALRSQRHKMAAI